MAAKKDSVKADTAPVTEKETQLVMDAPEGFVSDNAVQDAPWFNLEENNVLYGRLLGCYTMNTEPPRDYYQVELFQPCTVRVGKGEDAELTEAEAGDIVNVGISYQLKVWQDKLVPLVTAGALVDVHCKVGKKIKQKSGRFLWTLTPKSKIVKGPTSAVVRTVKDEAEDAPF